MKLSKCTIGTIVTNNKKDLKRQADGSFIHFKPFTRIGYISGLIQNCNNETIPLVKWSDELVMDDEIHYSNIEIYKEKIK